jgi:hypothetical protein
LPTVAATVWHVAGNGSRSPSITLPLATAGPPAAPANRMSDQVAVRQLEALGYDVIITLREDAA